MTLDEVNSASPAALTAALGAVFEHAPWVADRAAAGRPFDTVEALHSAMMDAVCAAPDALQMGFLRGHPHLGGAAARGGQLEAHSTAEQRALGLDALDADRAADIQRLNDTYLARFGFPFILCVARHTRSSILSQFRLRLGNTIAAERQAALTEIARITRLRLTAAVDGPGCSVTTGMLTTHVLDTATGRPAAGVPMALYEIEDGRAIPICTTITNSGGRTDSPLLANISLRIGTYELQFTVGTYFGAASAGFLDVIPVRFGITAAEAHYHIPLLVSPYAYSTYRGS